MDAHLKDSRGDNQILRTLLPHNRNKAEHLGLSGVNQQPLHDQWTCHRSRSLMPQRVCQVGHALLEEP